MTATQLKLLDFIRERIAARGVAPSLVEMAAHMRWANRGAAHAMVTLLVERGHLVRVPRIKRGIRLAGQPALASVPTEQLRAELERRAHG